MISVNILLELRNTPCTAPNLSRHWLSMGSPRLRFLQCMEPLCPKFNGHGVQRGASQPHRNPSLAIPVRNAGWILRSEMLFAERM
jgi:hypothetical protein